MAKVPLIGAAILLDTAGDLNIDHPVGTYVDLDAVDPSTTVADVLEHRAGLLHPDLATWRMLGSDAGDAMVPKTPQVPGPGYSDFLANRVLVAVIESITGTDAETFIRRALFEPAGVSDLLQYGATQPVVNPAVAGLDRAAVPLASERLPDQISIVSPATGIFASAKGLALLLHWLFFDGQDATRRLEAVSGRRSDAVTWDPILNRPASYAFGFMGDLALHQLGERAFGHTAAMAPWIAVVDPDEASVHVGYSNGIPPSETAAWEARNLLFAALNGDMDRVPAPQATADAAPTATGRPQGVPPIEGLGALIGDDVVLPSDCRMTVELVLTDDTTKELLYFERGQLVAASAAPATTLADVTLHGPRAVLAEWLSIPQARLGPLLHSGALTATGDLWFLSAFEYWAAVGRNRQDADGPSALPPPSA